MFEWAERAVAQRKWTVTAVLTLATLAAIIAVMPREPSVFDDGLILTNGLRILSGEIPHRDFYTNYGPGQPYIIAAVFALFGTNLFAARVVGSATMALCVGLGYLLMAGHVRPAIGLFVAGLAAAWLIAGGYHLYPIYPCLIFTFLSVMLLMRPAAIQERWPVLLAGGCAGIVALFRYDTGFVVLAGQFAFICLALPPQTSLVARLRSTVVPCFLAGIGSAITFFPFAISYLTVAPLSAFVRDIVEISMIYPEMRGLPFPGLAAIKEHLVKIGIYFPFFIAGVALLDIVFHWSLFKDVSGEDRDRSLLRLQLLLTIFSTLLIYKGINRASITHFMLAIVPGVFLAGAISERWLRSDRAHRVAAFVLLGLAFFPAFMFLGIKLREDARAFGKTTLAWVAGVDDASNTCPQDRATLLKPDYEATTRFLVSRVAEGERILVGTNRHDRILANPILLYAHAERLPATLWAQYDPGVQTTDVVQREMIGELKKRKVHWIVRDASWEDRREPNASSISSGVTVLDEFIEANYRPVARAGALSLWLANSHPAPMIPAEAACFPMQVGETGLGS